MAQLLKWMYLAAWKESTQRRDEMDQWENVMTEEGRGVVGG